ncbi:hypothetical protein [Photobacterium sp. J15]|uniref:hypothetical protein n=1 Tax=Photobacterium sp. J15 TaxID=265901 RepID=UPI0007E416EC|nr:hypothetical protein [Photobacterium sp. J15]
MPGVSNKPKTQTLSFSGTCRHCGNDTLIYIKETNVKTCALCHRQEDDGTTAEPQLLIENKEKDKKSENEIL